MNAILILLAGLSIAWTFREIVVKQWLYNSLKKEEGGRRCKENFTFKLYAILFHQKPFSCLKCLTGWTTFLIAACIGADYWYFYLPIGLFVGAMYERYF
jgi:hypothetical protein